MASNNPQTPPQQVNEVNTIAQQQKHQLDHYWNKQRQQMDVTDHDFKKHEFPLSRIKKIMKFDQDVEMVATEAPVLLAKACEFFIQELTIKSWPPAEHSGRRTLRKDDIVEAINGTDSYKFLFDYRHDGPAAGGSSSMFSSHADPEPVASSSSVPPSVQTWIRNGHDENEMNVDDENENEDEMIDAAN
ncbi:hypothetical protein ACET3Z_007554 [Daucus carota]